MPIYCDLGAETDFFSCFFKNFDFLYRLGCTIVTSVQFSVLQLENFYSYIKKNNSDFFWVVFSGFVLGAQGWI